MSSFVVIGIIALISLLSIAQATVPDSQTFIFVNRGKFGKNIAEYNASYRAFNHFTIFPFQLCFYNTTPGGYSLALSMGAGHPESARRWVWEANRGNLVGENATFSLGKDGNLVLAEADGDVVWQSVTGNKGVVGFKILGNGNMVLYDSNGNYLWQSFDEPTDTLLVGQSLQARGPNAPNPNTNRLTSRASPSQTVNGYYGITLEGQRLSLYNNSRGIPRILIQIGGRGSLEYVRFNSDPKTNALRWEYKIENSSRNGAIILSKPPAGLKTALTYLRLGMDANLKAYTYDTTTTKTGAWKETYALFN